MAEPATDGALMRRRGVAKGAAELLIWGAVILLLLLAGREAQGPPNSITGNGGGLSPAGRGNATAQANEAQLGESRDLTGHPAGAIGGPVDESMTVTVLRVEDPLPAGGYRVENPGERVVGVFMRMHNTAGEPYDSPTGEDATLVTSTGKAASDASGYTAGACSMLSSPVILPIPAGATVEGCLPFILKEGETALAFRFKLFYGDQRAEWNLAEPEG